jgi:hypothetical protein
MSSPRIPDLRRDLDLISLRALPLSLSTDMRSLRRAHMGAYPYRQTIRSLVLSLYSRHPLVSHAASWLSGGETAR